jgi:hypothetical protein
MDAIKLLRMMQEAAPNPSLCLRGDNILVMKWEILVMKWEWGIWRHVAELMEINCVESQFEICIEDARRRYREIRETEHSESNTEPL